MCRSRHRALVWPETRQLFPNHVTSNCLWKIYYESTWECVCVLEFLWRLIISRWIRECSICSTSSFASSAPGAGSWGTDQRVRNNEFIVSNSLNKYFYVLDTMKICFLEKNYLNGYIFYCSLIYCSVFVWDNLSKSNYSYMVHYDTTACPCHFKGF